MLQKHIDGATGQSWHCIRYCNNSLLSTLPGKEVDSAVISTGGSSSTLYQAMRGAARSLHNHARPHRAEAVANDGHILGLRRTAFGVIVIGSFEIDFRLGPLGNSRSHS